MDRIIRDLECAFAVRPHTVDVPVPDDRKDECSTRTVETMKAIYPLIEQIVELWGGNRDENHYAVAATVFNQSDSCYMGDTLRRLQRRWKAVMEAWEGDPVFDKCVEIIDAAKLSDEQKLELREKIENHYA